MKKPTCAFYLFIRAHETRFYEEIATEDAIPTDRVRKAIRYAFLAGTRTKLMGKFNPRAGG